MKLFSIKTLTIAVVLTCVSLLWNGCTPDPSAPTGVAPPGINSSFHITSDVTWTDINADQSVPDYVVGGNIVIEDDVMLTVMPGVVVEFANSCDGITIKNGAISAIGTADKPIEFRGVHHNAGSWIGLQIQNNDPRNELTYCKVSHAGSGGCGAEQAAINISGHLQIYPAQLKITNTEVSESGGYGIIIDKVSRFGAFSHNNIHNSDLAPIRITNPQLGSLDATSNFFTNGSGYNFVDVLGEGLINNNITLPSLARRAAATGVHGPAAGGGTVRRRSRSRSSVAREAADDPRRRRSPTGCAATSNHRGDSRSRP